MHVPPTATVCFPWDPQPAPTQPTARPGEVALHAFDRHLCRANGARDGPVKEVLCCLGNMLARHSANHQAGCRMREDGIIPAPSRQHSS